MKKVPRAALLSSLLLLSSGISPRLLAAKEALSIYFNADAEDAEAGEEDAKGTVIDFAAPFADREIVKHYIEIFSRDNYVKEINAALERAKPYLPYIVERVRHYELPEELIYLPIIESSYKTSAVSWVGAVGVWQFMKGSATPYGLAVNSWQDDRKDMYLATDAALRKIKAEMQITGDIELAMAAYNGGLNRVTRAQAICRARGWKADFWTMYDKRLLPRETMAYVPKLLAAAYVGQHLAKFEIPSATDSSRHQYVAVEATRQVSLELLAKEAGVDYDVLKRENAALNHGVTPPVTGSKGYLIKAPVDYKSALEKAIKSDAKLYDPSAVKFTPEPVYTRNAYYVRKGDTLSGIAYRHGVSLSALMAVNPGVSAKRLSVGRRVALPNRAAPRRSAPVAVRAVAVGAPAANAPVNRVPAAAKASGVYTVKKGDSLWAIATKHGTTVANLASRNGLDARGRVFPGMKLKVPL